MKKLIQKKYLQGVGLIEVLVTMVVVALGLVAVATLQGDFLQTTRENKTKAEAKSLCEASLEQFRDSLEISDYRALATNSTGETIAGITENFTRTWVVRELPDASSSVTSEQTGPDRRHVTMTCRWGELEDATAGTGDGIPDEEQNVTLETTITFDSIRASLHNASAAASSAIVSNPSTNQNSSDEIYDDNRVPLSGLTSIGNNLYTSDDIEADQVIKANEDGTTGSVVYICPDPGGTGANGLIPFNPHDPTIQGSDASSLAATDRLYYRRVHYKGDSSFEEAIELFEVNTANNDGVTADGTCTRVIRFNGGVMIPMKGTVFSRATTGNGQNQSLQDLNLFTFNATESGSYCFPKTFGTTDTEADYVCFVGGNCENNTEGSGDTAATNGLDTEGRIIHCPFDSTGNYIPGEDVGPGGWRGKIGLLGIAPEGLNVCFEEELASTFGSRDTSNVDTLDTARDYFTRRNGINEGINKPYACHNFLIVNGQSNMRNVGGECVAQSVGMTLASKKIQRDITGDSLPDNDYDPTVDETNCVAYFDTIKGSLIDSTNTSFDFSTVVFKINDNTEWPRCSTPLPADPNTCCTLDSFNQYACYDVPRGSNLKFGVNDGYATSPAFFVTESTEVTDTTITLPHVFIKISRDLTFEGSISNGSDLTSVSINEAPDAICTVNMLSTGGGQYVCTINDTALTSFTVTASGDRYGTFCEITSLPSTGCDLTIPQPRDITVTVNAIEDPDINNFTNRAGTLSDVSISGDSNVECNGTTCTVPDNWSGTLTAVGSCSGYEPTTTGSTSVSASDTTATINLICSECPVTTFAAVPNKYTLFEIEYEGTVQDCVIRDTGTHFECPSIFYQTGISATVRGFSLDNKGDIKFTKTATFSMTKADCKTGTKAFGL